MSKPVLIISDTHYHNFAQYAQLDTAGRSTRLMDILRASGEAVASLRAAGGNTVIHAGDVFHVRGTINPTVLNPVLDFYRNLIEAGLKVYMISGNHDIESNDANDLSSTVTALREVGVEVINADEVHEIDDYMWRFIPWVNDLSDLRAKVKDNKLVALQRPNLVIHAPMNGVIEGLPDHGLTTKDFDDTVWGNVFIGHYHNHKMFCTPDGATNIYSVGALTHQNWGDVNSKAGYVLYYPALNTVTQHQTAASRFVKIEFDDLDHPGLDITDNYVKVIGGSFTDPTDIQTVRNNLILRGAKAAVVEGLLKRPTVTRAGTALTGAPTLETILGDYIDRNYPGDAEIKLTALEILGEVYL